MEAFPSLDQLSHGILPALPHGVLLALLWLAIFRRKAEGLGAMLLPLWQLLFFLALGLLTFALVVRADARPAVVLLGVALAGLLLTAWISSGRSFSIGRKKHQHRRGRGRRGKRRTFSLQIEIRPGMFAPLLPLLTLAGLIVAVVLAVDSAPQGGLIATTAAPQSPPGASAPAPASPAINQDPGPAPKTPLLPPPDMPLPDTASATAVATVHQPMQATTADPLTQFPGPDKAPRPDPMPETRILPPVTQPVSLAPKTVSFRQQVVPILRQNCLDCHGEKKQKGELRLDSPDSIRKGGKNGPVIVAGVPERSPFYTMTTLDADDPDVMPSKGDLLSPEEQELLRTWVEEGADLEDGKPFGAVATAATLLPRTDIAPPTTDAAAVDSKTLAMLQRRFVVLRPLNNEHSLFEAVLRATDPEFPKPELKLLGPVAANLHTLDLARTEITDSDLAVLASCSNLTVLRLSGTPIGDAAMEHLKHLTRLRSINLTGTTVTDAGLAALEGIAALREVFAVGTRITAEGARRLEERTGAKVRGTFPAP